MCSVSTTIIYLETILIPLGPESRFQCSRVPVSVKFWPVPVDLAGTRLVGTQFFVCWIIGFICFALMSNLYHVLLSSFQTRSCAPLQFPGCITCYPPVHKLYHVLPSSSQTVSRAPLQFPG